MSSKRKKAGALTDTRHEDSDSIDNDMPQSWVLGRRTIALRTLAQAHNKLPEYLIDLDESFQPLVQYGHTWSKHLMCFTSINHIHRYRQDLLPAGTMDAPLVVKRHTVNVLSRNNSGRPRYLHRRREGGRTDRAQALHPWP